MLAKFTQWLLSLVIAIFQALLDLISDGFVAVVQLVFQGLAAVISALPAPSFLTQYSLNTLVGQLPNDVLFFASQLGIGTCFLVLGAGFGFRMLRKIVTLGQW